MAIFGCLILASAQTLGGIFLASFWIGLGVLGMVSAHQRNVGGLKFFTYGTLSVAILAVLMITWRTLINVAMATAARDHRCAGMQNEEECKAWFDRQYIFGIWIVYAILTTVVVASTAVTVTVSYSLEQTVLRKGSGDNVRDLEEEERLSARMKV
eukprot:CAMPEP_0204274454 /NCGR_PEP_ID=MMETSP0468-20130131/25198_1 /ASSEMBLY_ACC=CAM_ASM_000383 /TAXON_ID=2969 /ORGANISM="Oxyrrhis marina" /LENGTH=154 /DNA_ID=CAMNT_0051250667 /DNA_START=149 /DNA_END=613 /DNA_ORIENTATION=+